jgi:hypothetical protein
MYVNAPRTTKRSTAAYVNELFENGNGTGEMTHAGSAYLYKDGTVIKRRVLDSAGSATTNTVATTDGTETLSNKTLTSTTVSLAAGTTTVAPLTFASGTNLTSATTGSVEFDGKLFYGTSNSQRGFIPVEYFAVTIAQTAMTNDTSLQAMIPTSLNVDTITLWQSGKFAFEIDFRFSSPAYTNTIQIGFNGANIAMDAIVTMASSSSTSNAAAFVSLLELTDGTASTCATGAAATQHYGRVTGTLTATGAGRTFQPAIKFTAAPGAATYCEYVRVSVKYLQNGSADTMSLGPWA